MLPFTTRIRRSSRGGEGRGKQRHRDHLLGSKFLQRIYCLGLDAHPCAEGLDLHRGGSSKIVRQGAVPPRRGAAAHGPGSRVRHCSGGSG